MTGGVIARIGGAWWDGLADRLRSALAGFHIARVDLRLILVLLVVTRLALLAGLSLAYLADTSRVEDGAVDLFCDWDCNWYLGIATDGYQMPADISASGVANWAFFPLMPMVMAGLAAATGLPVYVVGLIAATLATGAGLTLAFLLVRDLFGVATARHATVVLALWPFAIHSAIPMTEALFVPLTIASFLFLRRRNWLLAGLMAGLLSATRTTGVLIFLPMLMIAIRDHGFLRLLALRPGTERVVLGLGLSGLGLALYMIYLHGLLGDAFAFSHNQAAWQRRFEFPWMTIYDAINPATIEPRWIVANALCVASGLAGGWLAVILWQRDLKPEAVFVGVTLLVAFASGSANSLPRYTGGLYPVTLAVALLTAGPLRRVPAYAFLAAGLVGLAFAWGMEQFYVM